MTTDSEDDFEIAVDDAPAAPHVRRWIRWACYTSTLGAVGVALAFYPFLDTTACPALDELGRCVGRRECRAEEMAAAQVALLFTWQGHALAGSRRLIAFAWLSSAVEGLILLCSPGMSPPVAGLLVMLVPLGLVGLVPRLWARRRPLSAPRRNARVSGI